MKFKQYLALEEERRSVQRRTIERRGSGPKTWLDQQKERWLMRLSPKERRKGKDRREKE